MAQRIGVLGGTFDPVHLGHLAIAEEARVCLPLDLVLLLPARVQPLRQGGQVSSPEHRAAMLERAILGNPALVLSRVEFERPGPSYTVDTMVLLRERYPRGSEFFFILGSDALADLPHWKEPKRLLALCQLVVFPRPGLEFEPRLLFLQLPLLRERIMRPIDVGDEEWSIGYGRTYVVDGLPLVGSWGGGGYTARAVARVGAAHATRRRLGRKTAD